MKRTFILLALVASMPLTMNAQDDMYFVPTKKNVEKSKKDYGMPKDTYYSGATVVLTTTTVATLNVGKTN